MPVIKVDKRAVYDVILQAERERVSSRVVAKYLGVRPDYVRRVKMFFGVTGSRGGRTHHRPGKPSPALLQMIADARVVHNGS